MNKHLSKIWKFLTYDIWRITEDEVTRTTYYILTVVKTISLCINNFTKDRLVNKASALTYSTLLAIVPIMAIVFAIARGFGFDQIMESQVMEGFGGNTETVQYILRFVNSYLSETKNGVFVGVGLVMLFWSVLVLINNMEITFNNIWQVKKARSVYRKVTDYLSMLLLMPILIVVSAGVSIFVGTMVKNFADYSLVAPLGKFLIRSIPYLLTWFMFTALYIFMPNTRVKFKHALVSGILAGTAYQIFQYLYIGGQMWVSRYNAIYGSFAALPLFLLWVQVSWTICLFGAQLTYAGQNISNFNFEKDTRNISRRYRDFITILIMSRIVKRFCQNEKPYTASELSQTYQIPIRLVNHTLFRMQEINLLHEVLTDEKSEEIAYQPSIDASKLSVGLLLHRLDCHGSEDFKIDTEQTYSHEWSVLMKARKAYFEQIDDVLLSDL